MTTLVTGATGFTGSQVVPLLMARGHSVRCLVLPGDATPLPDGAERFRGDLGDLASLRRAMAGARVLVNVASIGFGHGPGIVQAAEAAGVERAVFVSTTAIFTTLAAKTKVVRLASEEAIRSSRLASTILRPTMIFGSERDRNMCRLIRLLKRWPVIPILGSGNYLQQPVYVGDVARAIVDVVDEQCTVGKAYNIPGATAHTFNEVIDIICAGLGRRVRKLHIPARPGIVALHVVERLGLRAPIRAEQIQRLNEHKAFDFDDASADFGYDPLNFEQGIGQELRDMV